MFLNNFVSKPENQNLPIYKNNKLDNERNKIKHIGVKRIERVNPIHELVEFEVGHVVLLSSRGQSVYKSLNYFSMWLYINCQCFYWQFINTPYIYQFPQLFKFLDMLIVTSIMINNVFYVETIFWIKTVWKIYAPLLT